MKGFQLLSTVALLLIVASACKKNTDKKETGDDNSIFYDGKSYNIEKGLIWDYKEMSYSSHYSQSYFLKNGKEFASWSTQDLLPDDPPISIYYMLSSPGTDKFRTGTFKCYFSPDYFQWFRDNKDDLKNEFFSTSGYVNFDANGDREISQDEIHTVIGGTITVTADYTEYNLELSNGKKVTGRNAASFVKTLPPA